MARLVRNAIQTPDGTVIQSRSVHDYVTHKDANGKTYMIDGGLCYSRRSAHGDEVDLCIYDDESHAVLRHAAQWGTRGKDGKQPLTWIKIADMETDHIKACLKECLMADHYRKIMQDELEWRKADATSKRK